MADVENIGYIEKLEKHLYNCTKEELEKLYKDIEKQIKNYANKDN